MSTTTNDTTTSTGGDDTPTTDDTTEHIKQDSSEHAKTKFDTKNMLKRKVWLNKITFSLFTRFFSPP